MVVRFLRHCWWLLTSTPYERKLRGPKWQARRKRYFRERFYALGMKPHCEACGSEEWGLELHHPEYPEEIGTERDDQLVMLCPKDHRGAHKAIDSGRHRNRAEATWYYVMEVRDQVGYKRMTQK